MAFVLRSCQGLNDRIWLYQSICLLKMQDYAHCVQLQKPIENEAILSAVATP
jgi:hypothetical protein